MFVDTELDFVVANNVEAYWEVANPVQAHANVTAAVAASGVVHGTEYGILGYRPDRRV